MEKEIVHLCDNERAQVNKSFGSKIKKKDLPLYTRGAREGREIQCNLRTGKSQGFKPRRGKPPGKSTNSPMKGNQEITGY